MVAPLGTPPAIVAKVSADLKTATSQPDLQAQLAKLGAYTNPMDAAEANAFVNKQQAIWQPVLDDIAEQQASRGSERLHRLFSRRSRRACPRRRSTRLLEEGVDARAPGRA